MIVESLSVLRFGLDFEALFFDFDGVLADTEPVHFECWRQLLAQRGIVLTWHYYESECIGVADRAMLQRLGAAADPPQGPDELYDLYPLKKSMFREACMTRSPISAETRFAVEQIRNLPLAVVTSSGLTEVQPILHKTFGENLFRTAVYGSEVKNLKPSPEPYLTAAARCGVRKALVFEDSDAGIQSAHEAGHLVYRITKPGELPAALASLSI